MSEILRPTADPAWVLEEVGCDPLRESCPESRFAISNGFLGVRGAQAASSGERWVVPARTYVAGLFDTPGAEGAVPELVPAADWLHIRILLPDGPVGRDPGELGPHRMSLDMKRGALMSERLQSDALAARVRLRTLRLVSLAERAVGLQLVELEIEDPDVEVTLEASFEGVNLGLAPLRLEQDLGVWRTVHSGMGLAMAAAASLQIDGCDLPPTALGQLKWSWTWKSRAGQIAHVERLVAVARSDRDGLDDLGDRARDQLTVAQRSGWRGVVAEHEAAWADRWRCSDVEVDGDAAAQESLRFAVYHLNGAANPEDERVSIGARALTGDDYRGHVFWDTEIFLLPFYTLTWPEAARALLMYRFHTLDGARAKAARMGWRGALYAWESTGTGAETTPEHVIGSNGQVVAVLSGREEQHISADVAYAVWQYWQTTGDEAFLLNAGAEILFETARFWSSRARSESDGKGHIRGVIGPDEYHEHVDDNAFTNVMARWNIHRALELASLLRERWPEHWARLSSRLGLTDAELEAWTNAADTMATGLDPRTGLFEQFAGYFDLEEIDLAAYAGRSAPMDAVLGRPRTQRSQVIKQADVVALLSLLPEAFVGETGAKNFRYYEPRCSHGSSLSRPMHGLVAARLGDAEKALDYFRTDAAVDLADARPVSPGGVHIAALGGVWLMAVFGFAGLTILSDGLSINPHLPASWRSLTFGVQWRGRRLRVKIDQAGRHIEGTLESGQPMPLVVRGDRYELRRDQVLRVATGGPPGTRESRPSRGSDALEATEL